MKLIKPSFEILSHDESTINGIYKAIEIAGRNCYKSEDKITDQSCIEFVDRMVKSGHGAMLEHGTVYLKIEKCSPIKDMDYFRKMDIIRRYKNNKYSKVVEYTEDHYGYIYYITTNYRVITENEWDTDLQYLCAPEDRHKKRVMVRIITDNGVLREFTRHRVFSFAVESTRYCNYSKGKFNNEITYIIPPWLPTEDIRTADVKWDEVEFIKALTDAEKSYFRLLELGWKPQQARNVLPLDTKCDIIMTGFVSDWKHFFELRCPESAHPQAREIAIPLQEEFKRLKHI